MLIDPISSIMILSLLIIIFAVMASELKNLAHAIVSLFALTIVAGIIFFAVHAPYVGLVQLAVFSGAIIVLFIFVFIMTRGGVTEE